MGVPDIASLIRATGRVQTCVSAPRSPPAARAGPARFAPNKICAGRRHAKSFPDLIRRRVRRSSFAFLARKGRAERRACRDAREGLRASVTMHAGERERSTGTGHACIPHTTILSACYSQQRLGWRFDQVRASPHCWVLGPPTPHAGTSLPEGALRPPVGGANPRRPTCATGPSHPLRAVTYTASFNWSGWVAYSPRWKQRQAK